MVNLDNSACLPTGTAQIGFREFVSQCLNDGDKARTGNVISYEDLKNLFIDQQAQAQSLLQNLQAIFDLKNGANINLPDLGKQKKELEKTIKVLEDQIQEVDNQIEVANQTFIEKVIDTPPSSQVFGNLQDISLGVFFISLIVLGIILAILQLLNPQNTVSNKYGGLVAAFYTLLTFGVIIIVVYALLIEIA